MSKFLEIDSDIFEGKCASIVLDMEMLDQLVRQDHMDLLQKLNAKQR